VPTLLVFGARNVGRVLARELTADGWNAAAVARTQDTIDALRAEVPDALGIVADATSSAEVERAFAETQDRFGPVDLVVSARTAHAAARSSKPHRTHSTRTCSSCSPRSSTSFASARAFSSRKAAVRSSR
jgi:NAD(P)-dependent dehydrogenase (short-subunit alcohol dehydrogenase family)